MCLHLVSLASRIRSWWYQSGCIALIVLIVLIVLILQQGSSTHRNNSSIDSGVCMAYVCTRAGLYIFCYHTVHERVTYVCVWLVCVCFMLSRFRSTPSTSSSPRVRADSSWRDTGSVVTKPRHRDTTWYSGEHRNVKGIDDAMPCHRITGCWIPRAQHI